MGSLNRGGFGPPEPEPAASSRRPARTQPTAGLAGWVSKVYSGPPFEAMNDGANLILIAEVHHDTLLE